MARAFLIAMLLSAMVYAFYDLGFTNGRKDAIRQLFMGEQDFQNYLAYRKQQMEDGHE